MFKGWAFLLCPRSEWRVLLNKSPMVETENSDFVSATCLLLVDHFRNILLLSKNGAGFHTRMFSHILHPEKHFVYAGQSEQVTSETPIHLEHVVPCATLIAECKRLIKAETHSQEDIAILLKKH